MKQRPTPNVLIVGVLLTMTGVVAVSMGAPNGCGGVVGPEERGQQGTPLIAENAIDKEAVKELECGPATCPGGCCSNGLCVPGTSKLECGSGGAACVACAPPTGVCTDQKCVACDATSCPTGCCLGGVCMARSDATCGTAGSACTNCLVNNGGRSCKADGTCSTCDAASCPNGCCDAAGVCRLSEDATCGTGGGACTNCSADAKQCVKGKCTECNATTCPNGCCKAGQCMSPSDQTCLTNGPGGVCDDCTLDSLICSFDGKACVKCDSPTGCTDGCCKEVFVDRPIGAPGNRNITVCKPGNDVLDCGTKGAACVNCSSKSQTCTDARTCVGCNKDSCPDGCCTGSGECVTPGTADKGGDFVCGSAGGGACESCLWKYCNPTTGKCERPPCNPTTCPNGCCKDGVCESGTTRSACGGGGGACTTCPFNSSCTYARTCVKCDETSCPNGCCDSNGQCQQDADACGNKGSSCEKCPYDKPLCDKVNGGCAAKCDANTCPTGCCLGNTCYGGTTDRACGYRGASCADCTKTQTQCSALGDGSGGQCKSPVAL